MDYCFFLHAAFLICGFVRCNCFCLFRVWIDAFVSLYVSEFLIAACGVSPLRGRPKDSALWNPAALERLANFFLWVRVCWCCSPEYKKQKENCLSSSPIKKTQSSICTPRCAIIVSVSLLLPSMPGKTRTSMPHSAMLCSPSMSRNTVSLSSEISPMSVPILPPALRPSRGTAV